jgi:exodeoxyribonuclease-5
LDVSFSPDQQAAIEYIKEWFDSVRGRVEFCGSDDQPDAEGENADCPKGAHTHGPGITAPIKSLGGYAGTGKTSIIKYLVKALDAEVSYGTPTHKAARVLRGKLEYAQKKRVNTFYSLVYIPDPKFVCDHSGKKVKEITRECTCGEAEDDCACAKKFEPCGSCAECKVKQELNFLKRQYMKGHTELLVVDESSMLSEDQVEDIRQFGVPILLVGDHGQLPPVKARMNPWIAKPDIVLTENHRQKNDTSGIVDIALWARDGNQLRKGVWGDGRAVVLGKDDDRMDLLMDAQRYLEKATLGVDLPAIICANNKTRAGINMRFHGEGPPRPGDRVVALRRCEVDVVEALDNGNKPILSGDGERRLVHNGHTGTIRAITGKTTRTVNMVVELDDTNGKMVWVTRAETKQFGSPGVLGEHERGSNTRLWDYAYAMTCHKAQGSEWDDVIVLNEAWSDKARWLYTAVTRAKKKLVVVEF